MRVQPPEAVSQIEDNSRDEQDPLRHGPCVSNVFELFVIPKTTVLISKKTFVLKAT